MKLLVLVIDDSLTMRKILETCLGREGYKVKSFADGIEALHWLGSKQARPPALIFVDLGLPRLDGYEVLRQLKGRVVVTSSILVVLSKREGVLDRLKARLAGAHAYLSKPCPTSAILSLVQTALAPSLSMNTSIPSPQGGSR